MSDMNNKVKLLREALGYSMRDASKLVEAIRLLDDYEVLKFSERHKRPSEEIVNDLIKERRGVKYG